MFDRLFTAALAVGLLALAVSTTVTFMYPPAGPRLIEFDRVFVTGKRLASIDGNVGVRFSLD